MVSKFLDSRIVHLDTPGLEEVYTWVTVLPVIAMATQMPATQRLASAQYAAQVDHVANISV